MTKNENKIKQNSNTRLISDAGMDSEQLECSCMSDRKAKRDSYPGKGARSLL